MARQWKSFGVDTTNHSPPATPFTKPVNGLTTRVHTLGKMCPLMARDSRLVSAAPLAVIEAAGEDGLVLAMRLARPCRGTIRFLYVIQYAHFGNRGCVSEYAPTREWLWA